MFALSRSVFCNAPCELRQLFNYAILRPLSTSSTARTDARPSTAPKQFPDLKAIRANPEQYARNCLRRRYEAHTQVPEKITQLGLELKRLENLLREPRKKIKTLSSTLAPRRDGTQIPETARSQVMAEISSIREEIDGLEKLKATYEEESHTLALTLPNLTSDETPIADEPRLIKFVNYDPGNPPKFPDTADHSYIGKELSLLDFMSASKTTGWGFYYLMNEAALLEQALIQYALSVAMKRGWRAISPPSLVYSHMADACGFQPRDQNDEQQIWQIVQPERDAGKPRRSLAATAEIPLAGLYASSSIPHEILPVKLVGSSRCYRAEAGARGIDTKGLYRVHEFTKVEMFAWTQNENSRVEAVFDEMIEIQTEILTSLGLPFRVLEMPAIDLGASAFRKIDIEALFPSRLNRDDGWGEVTSASICTDYQSRRLDTRIADKNGGKAAFPHTVNGTALAVPRVLAALLENHWEIEKRCIKIPAVLWPYMGGIERITGR